MQQNHSINLHLSDAVADAMLSDATMVVEFVCLNGNTSVMKFVKIVVVVNTGTQKITTFWLLGYGLKLMCSYYFIILTLPHRICNFKLAVKSDSKSGVLPLIKVLDIADILLRIVCPGFLGK